MAKQDEVYADGASGDDAAKAAVKHDPMSKDMPKPARELASEPGKGNWPYPGEEGFVHPDGTPESRKQLEDNRQAAAERAAAGSIVHGAPLGTPGPVPAAETAKAVKRAEENRKDEG